MTKALGFLLVGSLALTGCATHSTRQSEAPKAAQEAPAETAAVAEAPVPEAKMRPFPADSFYDLLVAEFALRRGEYDLALNNYQQQAHTTRDEGVISRTARHRVCPCAPIKGIGTAIADEHVVEQIARRVNGCRPR